MAQHPACSILRAASRVRIPELVGGLEHEFYFPFHIWDVIPTPLTNSIIFQDGEIAPPTREKLLGTWPTFG